MFFTDGANTVYAFSGQTGVPLKSYTIANGGPIASDLHATRIYVATPSKTGVTVVDASSGKTIATVALPGAIFKLSANSTYHELFGLAANDRRAYIVYTVTNQYRGYILEPTTSPMSDITLNDGSDALYLGGGTTVARYFIGSTGVPQPRGLYHLPNSLQGFHTLAVDAADQYVYALAGMSAVKLSASSGSIIASYPAPTPDPTTDYNPTGLTLGQ